MIQKTNKSNEELSAELIELQKRYAELENKFIQVNQGFDSEDELMHHERKLVEQALRDSNELFKTTLYSIGDAVIVTDRFNTVRNLNAIAEKLTGWTEKEAINVQLSEVFKIINEKSRKIVENPVDIVMRDGTTVGLANHTLLISKNGEEIPIADSAAPIKNENGEILGVVLVFRDQTMERESRRDIEQSELRLRRAELASKSGNWEIHFDQNIGIASKGASRIYGLGKSKFSIAEIQKYPLPEYRPVLDEALANLVQKNIPYQVEFKIRTADTNEIKDIRSVAFFDKEKNSLFGVIQDISEKKQLQERQEVLFNISNAVMSTDSLEELNRLITYELSKIIDTSNFYIALYNRNTDTLSIPFMVDQNDRFDEVKADKTLTGYVIKTEKSLYATSEVFEDLEQKGEIELIGTPSKVWVGVPLTLKNQVIGAIVCQSYLDESALTKSDLKVLEFVAPQISLVLERKKSEEELKRALKKAQESDRLKSAFLANMSHEIRTPMNGIMGFAQLLKEPALGGESQQRYIGIIEKSGARMLNIINNLINISKVEAGQMPITFSAVNVNEQLEYIYAFFKPEADAKGLQLFVMSTLKPSEAVIRTDAEKLTAILSNLVKNAIKYTRIGSIFMGVEIQQNSLVFFVKDSGVGVPKDRQFAIFERFVQADIEDIKVYEGAGLGLTISKAYVEMIGGRIWLDSEEGDGSQFYFSLPNMLERNQFSAGSSTEKKLAISNTSKKLKILVVEDDETANLHLAILLEHISNEILHAVSGDHAVEICKNHPDVDLILMDIKMPVMNGFEATRQIREFNKDVIIIAQTAYALEGDREKTFAVGCDDYITKPLQQNELMMLIKKHFEALN
ncbi:MAG: ATP-binding protein [Bacteroidales bacterium]|nr:ATP-binding protein [Bacteroidales bacterium]